jgi:hypothetical protein
LLTLKRSTLERGILTVQDSQPADKTSDPILSKLIEADSELTTQEAKILAQLETIQEKRKGLKTVIGMFSSDGAAADLLQQLESLPNSGTNGTSAMTQNEATATNGMRAIAEAFVSHTSDSETTEAPTQQKGRGSKKTSSAVKESSSKKRGSKLNKTSKPPRRSLGWQQYIRDEFGRSSLAEAIPQVLSRKPNDVLDTGEIIDAIFVEDIPKEVRSTVRERVSNILSSGLKVNKWYRGKTGCYSISRSVAEASLAS